ncbi:unnamed protein product [Calypogeia fissa]
MFDFLKREKKGDLVRVLEYPLGIIFDRKFSDDLINRWAEKWSHLIVPVPVELDRNQKSRSQSDIFVPSKHQKVDVDNFKHDDRDFVEPTEVGTKTQYDTTSNDMNNELHKRPDTWEDLEEANESGWSDGNPSTSHSNSTKGDSPATMSREASLNDSGSKRFLSPSRDALALSKALANSIVSRHVSFKDSEILPATVKSPTFRVI